MLISNNVNIKLSSKNIPYYRELGYDIPYHIDNRGRKVSNGEYLTVKVEDIPLHTQSVIVKVSCDYCGKECEKTYSNYNKGRKIIEKDACEECKTKKTKEVNIAKYGTNKKSELAKTQGFKNGRNKIDFNIIYEEFISKNLIPLFDETYYIDNNCNVRVLLPCKCKIHTDEILYISYDDLKTREVGCKFCVYENRKGENNNNWKGGISPENEAIRKSFEYKRWRRAVFKKDNYTCQCCGRNRKIKINAHHLDGYNWCVEKRFDKENGVTLCEDCHREFHYKYGYGNNTKEQLSEYMSIKLGNLDIQEIKVNKVETNLSVSVICLTTNKIFKSIKEAYLYYNLPHHLGEALKKNKEYYGKLSDGTKLKWMYYDEYLKQAI